MPRIERAIIMAAGIGKRMQPVTFDIPKPLILVNGIRMIDSVINALHVNNINEIYVVVGYHKEQFYKWANDRGDINLIENPYFNTCNNISSLYVARGYLENAIILDGDQIIYNSSILTTEFQNSGYNAIPVTTHSNEWVMQINEEGFVTSCSRTGGDSGWQLFSVSRWNKEDGKKLRKLLEYEFLEKKNQQIYWDDIPMFCHFDKFKLGIHPMKKEDIIEIDNFDELIQLDDSYLGYKGGKTK